MAAPTPKISTVSESREKLADLQRRLMALRGHL